MTPFDDDDKRQQAIHYYRGIANANLEDDCLHDINLFYLASALHEQFDRDGYIALLSEAIDLYRKTLKFRRTGHPLRDTSLNALGIGLHDQFRQNGGKEKIHEAILLHQEALDLRPPGHPLRLTSLNNMGVIYSLLFKSDGNPDVLAKTIHTHTEQLSLCPPNHRLRVPGLCNLAIALHESFGLHGREEDLTKSIRLHREAVSLFPQGNPRRGIILNALSNALRDRFKLYRDLDSFSEAVSIQREVLALRPAGHPGRATSLHNLALTLLNSLEPSESNLSEITVYLEEAIGLYPPDITLHWDSHCYLACALSQLATIRKDNSVFLKAIELHRESVSSSHLDSPYRDDYFFQMGKTFWELYKFSGNQEDLTAAFRGHHEALQIRGMGHPRRVFSHHAISQILLNPRVHRIDEGLDHVESANLDPYCPARKRLELLLKIVPILESTASCENPINKQRTSRRVLEVYIQAIELLPQAAHLGMNLVSRLRELVGTEHLCRVAAIRALLLDKPAVAVEILEEGRTVLWAQSLCLRRTNDLQSLRDDERLTLSRLFHTLEHQSQIIPETSESKTELERRLDDLRRLNAEAQSMLRQIRSRPGFARFMKIESFEKLTNASQSGPVVFLVATDLACFAVVLTGWASPATVVRLDEVTPCLLQEWRIRIRDSSQRDDSYDVREHDSSQDIEFDRLGCYKLTPGALSVETQVYRTLSKLWQAIVQPVIHALDLKVFFNLLLSRISNLSALFIIEGNRRCQTARSLVSCWRLCILAAPCSRNLWTNR
jgi:tetratricopeptide (TPR) repeat protein